MSDPRYTSTSAGKPERCPYCGCYPSHTPEECLQVKAIEYHPNGAVKRVEKR